MLRSSSDNAFAALRCASTTRLDGGPGGGGDGIGGAGGGEGGRILDVSISESKVPSIAALAPTEDVVFSLTEETFTSGCASGF